MCSRNALTNMEKYEIILLDATSSKVGRRYITSRSAIRSLETVRRDLFDQRMGDERVRLAGSGFEPCTTVCPCR
jgi:hypothetical protein